MDRAKTNNRILFSLLIGCCLLGASAPAFLVLRRAAPFETATARPRRVTAAAIQFLPVMGRSRDNRRTLAGLVRRAARSGADIVVVPETALQGYMTPDGSRVWCSPGFQGTEKEISLAPYAETVPGPSVSALARLANRLDIHLLFTLVEVDAATGKHYNTAVFLDPEGRILLHYRKAYPWTVAEYAWAEDGPGDPAVVDTPFGRIGVCICYDVHGMLPRLAEAGADIVLWPVWWVDHSPDVWFEERLPLLCRKHGIRLVAANRASAGVQGELPGAGWSCLINRRGLVVAMAPSAGECIVLGHFPPGRPEPGTGR